MSGMKCERLKDEKSRRSELKSGMKTVGGEGEEVGAGGWEGEAGDWMVGGVIISLEESGNRNWERVKV